MRALPLFIALAGCGFRSRAAPDALPAEPDASAPPDGPADAASPFCDPADGNLVACYELDGDGHDGSPNHLDAAPNNVTFPEGKVGMAMLLAADSTADVTDAAAFDVSALTLEAWIRLAQLPTASARATVLDMNMQYSLVLRANGELQCTLVGGVPLAAAAHVASEQWAHVACTYDGHDGALYVNGVAIANAGGGEALHTGGTTGISLGSDNPSDAEDDTRLIGLLDQVRIFKIARTAQQICQDAGRASCP